MNSVRAALYLDFDNVFGGLFKLDPDVAIEFAKEPGAWLERLATTAPTTDLPRRRWLILRCYLNPAGWLPHRDAEGEPARLFFSRFRPAFVRAGFEVIDCPRYNATKNGADIRMVVDAIDAMAGETRYDEFVIASGDSDMTPLLQRLRRSDRRTVIVSAADAAEAYTAIADRVLGSQHFVALVQGEPVDLDDDLDDDLDTDLDTDLDDAVEEGAEDPPADPGTGAGEVAPVDREVAYAAFRALVFAEYQGAEWPLNKATLAHLLRREQGRAISETNWFGLGSFTRAVESLGLPNMRMSEHLLWDEVRHPAPESTGAAVRIALPEPVERLAEQLNLPRLPRSSWPAIYRVLSDYAHSHRFNLTQCTSWTRDQLREQGVPVSRAAVGFVVRGTAFGGSPLHRLPAPTAAEIGAAYVDNVLARADAAEIAFTDEETDQVRAWLGYGDLPGPTSADGAEAPA